MIVTFTRRRGPAHRAATVVRRSSQPLSFEPRHCAGDSCLHNHTGGSLPLVGRVRNLPRAESPAAPQRKPWERAS